VRRFLKATQQRTFHRDKDLQYVLSKFVLRLWFFYAGNNSRPKPGRFFLEVSLRGHRLLLFVLSGTLGSYCNSPINQPFVAFMCLHKQRERAGERGRKGREAARGRGSRFWRSGRAVGKKGFCGGKARNVSGHSFVITQPWTNPDILAVIRCLPVEVNCTSRVWTSTSLCENLFI